MTHHDPHAKKGPTVPKKTIPHPNEMGGDHAKAFAHLIEQYLAGHYGFTIVTEPEVIGGSTNRVRYVVDRYDVNPKEPAEPHGLDADQGDAAQDDAGEGDE